MESCPSFLITIPSFGIPWLKNYHSRDVTVLSKVFEQSSVHFLCMCAKASLRERGKKHGWLVEGVTFADCLKENIKSYTYKDAKKRLKTMMAS